MDNTPAERVQRIALLVGARQPDSSSGALVRRERRQLPDRPRQRPERRDRSGQLTTAGPTPQSRASGRYTYTVQAIDALGHVTSAHPLTVRRHAPSATAPQQLSARLADEHDAAPHLAAARHVRRHELADLPRRRARERRSTTRRLQLRRRRRSAGRALHSYVGARDERRHAWATRRAPITVVYDTVAPALARRRRHAESRTVRSSSSGLPATDPAPGAGLSGYIVRRGGPDVAARRSSTAGTSICTVTRRPRRGVSTRQRSNGSIYGYSVFAVDGAGNVARQIVSARAVDTVAPDPVTGFRGLGGPDQCPPRSGMCPPVRATNADLAGYRIIKLGRGIKQPDESARTAPRSARASASATATASSRTCTHRQEGDVRDLRRGRGPNYSAPTLLTITPNSSDHKKPGLPTKVRLKRVGAKITMTWVSPKDRDLSKFRVTLYDNGPAARPSIGKAIVTGRVLRASFKLKAGQIVYVNLFAIDLSGNFSRVTRLIVMPDKLVARKGAKQEGREEEGRGHEDRAEEDLSGALARARRGRRSRRPRRRSARPARSAGARRRGCARGRRACARRARGSARAASARAPGSVSVMRSYGAYDARLVVHSRSRSASCGEPGNSDAQWPSSPIESSVTSRRSGQQRAVAIGLGVAVGLLAAHALDARRRHAGQQRLCDEAVARALVVGRDASLVAEVERDPRPVEPLAPGLATRAARRPLRPSCRPSARGCAARP